MFVISLTDFISLLETENFVDAKKYAPMLTYSYSLYLIGATVGCQLVCAIVMFLLIKSKDECPNAILAEIEMHKKIRGKRRKEYFMDCEAATHITEKTPVDSFVGQGHNGMGWTLDVHTQQVNVMYTDDHVTNQPPATLCPPKRLEPIQPLTKEAEMATELIEAPVSPTGFSAEFCLNVAPPELPGSVQLASSLVSGFSKSKTLDKLRVVTKQRTRNVTRAPPRHRVARANDKVQNVVNVVQ